MPSWLFWTSSQEQVFLSSHLVNFEGLHRFEDGKVLESRLLKAPYKAIAADLEELELLYTPELGLQSLCDWPSNMIFHAPKLRKLALGHRFERERPEFIQTFASTDLAWPPLQELYLSSIQTSTQDFTTLFQRISQSLRVLKLAKLRLKSSHDNLKSMLQALSTGQPALNTVTIDVLWSGLHGWDLVQFPAVIGNPAVDRIKGTKIGYKLVMYENANRAFTVEYSGPKIDVALDILARTADLVPYI